MKLRHKIAGTLALPLALAIASTANAATVYDDEKQTLKIGGFVAAQAYWEMPDAGEVNYGMDLGTSRLNVTHTSKTSAGDITFMYEQNIANNTLRHAVIMYDGWVAGQTWSMFANLNGLGETLDANGNAITSSWASRRAMLGKNFSLGEGMSVGVAFEEKGDNAGNPGNASPMPDLTANFKAKVGGVGLFAAAQLYQVNDATDPKASEGKARFTASAAVPIADVVTVKAALTSDTDKYNAVSVSGQFKITDQVRTNLVVESYMDDGKDKDYTQVWVNAIYRMQSGLEWGAEVQMVSGDTATGGGAAVVSPAAGAGVVDGDMAFRLQAKYAF
ncbi:hypothetical protein [Marinospirillum minutulum]|uniref:hypothetical protein n=1 Tax=Marinospirillum minutulum TaxID=64974 RepID=UPI0003F998BE|nr:hypothetical protein [Marinospirillum minutulum]